MGHQRASDAAEVEHVGERVHGTDMLAGVDVPKAPPGEVAARLLGGLTADQEDIFPDANAEAMSTLWRNDPKAVERALAGAAA